MSYSVLLTGDSSHPRTEIENYLEKLPGVRREADVWFYADEEEDVSIELSIWEEGGRVQRVDVIVPVEVSEDAAGRLTEFLTGLASRFGWKAQDAVSGNELSNHALRQRFSGAPPPKSILDGCAPAVLLGFLLPLAYLFLHR